MCSVCVRDLGPIARVNYVIESPLWRNNVDISANFIQARTKGMRMLPDSDRQFNCHDPSGAAVPIAVLRMFSFSPKMVLVKNDVIRPMRSIYSALFVILIVGSRFGQSLPVLQRTAVEDLPFTTVDAVVSMIK